MESSRRFAFGSHNFCLLAQLLLNIQFFFVSIDLLALFDSPFFVEFLFGFCWAHWNTFLFFFSWEVLWNTQRSIFLSKISTIYEFRSHYCLSHERFVAVVKTLNHESISLTFSFHHHRSKCNSKMERSNWADSSRKGSPAARDSSRSIRALGHAKLFPRIRYDQNSSYNPSNCFRSHSTLISLSDSVENALEEIEVLFPGLSGELKKSLWSMNQETFMYIQWSFRDESISLFFQRFSLWIICVCRCCLRCSLCCLMSQRVQNG